MNVLQDHPLWLRGIDEFNRREYFRCHESWETLWKQTSGEESGFYKGLIQAAVALFHLRKGNAHGAEKLLAGAHHYLAPYRPGHGGLDLEQFLGELDACVRSSLSLWEGSGRIRVELQQVPQIRVNRSAESLPA